MTNTKAIGARIASRRVEQRLSQSELAQKMQTSQNRIYYYEAGLFKNIKRDFLHQLCLALDTTEEYLLGLEDERLKELPEEVKNWIKTAEGKKTVIESYKKWMIDHA